MSAVAYRVRTVGELRAVLEDVPDTVPVTFDEVPAPDGGAGRFRVLKTFTDLIEGGLYKAVWITRRPEDHAR
jgi:hypothetical protein